MTKPSIGDYLWYGGSATLGGTLVGSSLLSLTWLLQENQLSVAQWVGEAAAISLYGFLVAIPVVIIYGMPLYSFAARLGWATWWAALFFGALPGLLWIYWTHGPFADPILYNGTSIAVLFHLLMARNSLARQDRSG